MIRIGSPEREMDARFLRAPGGFAWWYADLITPEGDGLVAIWSYGLPFLPGYAAASRAGSPQLPIDRPSLNLAVYERGRATLYLLQEYAPEAGGAAIGDPAGDGAGRRATRGFVARGGSAVVEAAPTSVEEVRIGDSLCVSRLQGGRRSVELRLDCEVPGTGRRLTGRIGVDGVAAEPVQGAYNACSAPHLWTPLTGPARGEATLDFGGERILELTARAYHDRNGGSVPLHELGIERWMWGRTPLRDRELIYYLLWPSDPGAPQRHIGLSVSASGVVDRIEPLEVELEGERRTLGGLRWPRLLRLRHAGSPWLAVEQVAIADSGPFYLRFQSIGEDASGARARGWGELCYPDRVDLSIHRPFVRMRVHRPGAGNSIWLPLFAGPRAGRVRRLLAGALRGRGA